MSGQNICTCISLDVLLDSSFWLNTINLGLYYCQVTHLGVNSIQRVAIRIRVVEV